MGMKKTTSLKASFWKFLYMLLIGLIGAVAIPFSLILAGTSTGLITPMRIIQNAAQKILLLLLPQRRIWQMCSFLWAVNIWCWIKIIK